MIEIHYDPYDFEIDAGLILEDGKSAGPDASLGEGRPRFPMARFSEHIE